MDKPRTGQRFLLKLPVELQWKSAAGRRRKAAGKIRDISSSGIFIAIPVRVPRATSISIKTVLPIEVTRVPVELLCKGRVVRWIESGPVQGVCVTIDEYDFRLMAQSGPGVELSPKAAD